MTVSPRIVGVGEIIYDHVFSETSDGLRYVGSRGGGPIGNILSNDAADGGIVSSVLVGGDDNFGQIARDELSCLGVDVSHTALLPKRRTRVIAHIISGDANSTSVAPPHQFTTTCPVCKIPADEKMIAMLRKLEPDQVLDLEPGVVCVDRLTSARVSIATECRKQKILTALDLGRIGYLRYVPISEILYDLRQFDIVLMPRSVANSLQNRLRINGLSSLQDFGIEGLILVSGGSDGVELYDFRDIKDPQYRSFNATLCKNPVDAAGAGDKLYASILRTLLTRYSETKSFQSMSLNFISEAVQGAVQSLHSVLTTKGARGHLPFDMLSRPLNDFCGMLVNDIQKILPPISGCAFCGSTEAEKQEHPPRLVHDARPGGKENVRQWLIKRTKFATERRVALGRCKSLLTELSDDPGSAYVIGSGGSFSVAYFLSQLLTNETNYFCQAIRPYDYIRTGRPTSAVFVISYSGATQDCAEAIFRAHQLGVKRVILITGAAKPKLQRDLRPDSLDCLISYARTTSGEPIIMEKGFVSIAGTVAPCALWAAAAVPERDMFDFICGIEHSDANMIDPNWATFAQATGTEGQSVYVFGGGFAWPAMMDIESKFTEANLGTVQLHESKDFSHGRFISVLDKKRSKMPLVYLAVGDLSSYERRMLAILEDKHICVVIQSKHYGILGGLDLLVRVQFLVQLCGEAQNKDMSRPKHIPPDGLNLYRWPGTLE